MDRYHVIRLNPGTDLKLALSDYISTRQISAGAVVTCVGSLKQLDLRLANANECLQITGLFEIVSLVGTLCVEGFHLHISVADCQGKVIGGHLNNGNIIHTTAEIVLLELAKYHFIREPDLATGYRELVIKNK